MSDPARRHAYRAAAFQSPPADVSPSLEASGKEMPASRTAARQYIRGSSLLLAGRVISVLLNLAVQVLSIRFLSRSDYGAFAYGLAAAALASTAIQVGLVKAIGRLVPIYCEQRNYARTFGAIALAASTIWGLGVLLILVLHALRGVLSHKLVTDPLSLSLLLLLIALAPLTAFDSLLQLLSAIFIGPRAIFFRRYVLGPAMKLVAVAVVMLSRGSVYLLAYGYLVGALVGIWVYVAILLREWRKQGLLSHMRPSRADLPARELFGFGVPMVSSELSQIVPGSLAVLILGHFHAPGAVAEYRAVLPLAALNLFVYEAFHFLFVPVASRMFARSDKQGISDLYWQTSIWLAVLTFPIFAVTCSLAQPVTTLLFGARYSGAGTLLALLAVGHYFSAALGFNAATLRVHGNIRFIVTSDLLSALLALGLSVALISRYGALGAAMSTTLTLILRNVFNQVGLWICDTGIRLVEWQFARVYLLTSLVMAGLLVGEWLLAPPLYVSFGLAALASLLLIRLTRRAVNPAATFPELLRIPLVRQLLT
jgi:O-antigen/teichoic acid export membrane protein